MNIASVDIKNMLLSNSELGFTFGTDLYIGKEPTTPDNCVTIFDMSGDKPDSTLSGSKYYRDKVNIQIRNTAYVAGYTLAQQIEDFLISLSQTTWNGVLYTAIVSEDGIDTNTWDENSNSKFNININIQRR